MSMVAIITARGGSKRIPRKNLHLLAGLPLVAHTIVAAIESERFAKIFVTTEDEQIASVSAQFGALIIDRPPELATDDCSSEDVVVHALDWISARFDPPRHLCLLQPTSPLRDARHITEAVDKYLEGGGKPLLSVTPAPANINKLMFLTQNGLNPYFGFTSFKLPGYSLGDCYLPNGAIYILTAKNFMSARSFYADDMTPYVMASTFSVDIDEIGDMEYAEFLLTRPFSSVATTR